MTKKVIVILAVVIVISIPLGTIVWLSSWHDPAYDVPSLQFDPMAWRRAEQIADYRTVRSQMVDDLLKRYDFTGWTREQVIDLLGAPDPTWSRPGMGFDGWGLVYHLGIERKGALSLDDECLVFGFMEGKVVSFRTTVN
jgi:hypothetical protein